MAQGVGLTEAIATHVAHLNFDQLPPEVVEKAKDIVLDALGGQLACSTLPHGRMAIDYARRQAGRPDSTVIGTDFKTSAEHAALVNGIQGHGDEIDESLIGFGHASAVLVPAVLAVGEREASSGREVIVALVAGYDVAARLARAGFNLDVLAPRNFQQGSTAGSMAAAMAAGSLLHLDPVRLQAAIGLGAEQACGLQAMRTETGHMNKSLHMGVGSRNGVAAAYLAEAGYGGAFTTLDPPWSVFEAFMPNEPRANPAALVDGLGSRFDILSSRFKRYASGSPTHCAIASIQAILKDNAIDPGQIDRIHVTVPTLEQSLLSHALTLNINFEYIIAVAALDGVVSWDQYTEERQQDPILRDLHARTTSAGNPELDTAKQQNEGSRPAEVTLRTRDGQEFTKRMLYPPGHPKNPLSRDELDEKFMFWSTRVLSTVQASTLRETIASLEDVSNVNTLGDLLRI
jgi:2-methylcitrate dehydratase PrpD